MKMEAYDAANDEERDDEKPVVVVLKPGDLSEEDLKKIEDEKGEYISKRYFLCLSCLTKCIP